MTVKIIDYIFVSYFVCKHILVKLCYIFQAVSNNEAEMTFKVTQGH